MNVRHVFGFCIVSAVLLLVGACASTPPEASKPLDPRLVGAWKGTMITSTQPGSELEITADFNADLLVLKNGGQTVRYFCSASDGKGTYTVPAPFGATKVIPFFYSFSEGTLRITADYGMGVLVNYTLAR